MKQHSDFVLENKLYEQRSEIFFSPKATKEIAEFHFFHTADIDI